MGDSVYRLLNMEKTLMLASKMNGLTNKINFLETSYSKQLLSKFIVVCFGLVDFDEITYESQDEMLYFNKARHIYGNFNELFRYKIHEN